MPQSATASRIFRERCPALMSERSGKLPEIRRMQILIENRAEGPSAALLRPRLRGGAKADH
jgi:hypothetical protein